MTKRWRKYLLRGSECLSKLSVAAVVTTFSSTNFTFFREPIPQVTTGGLHDNDDDADGDNDDDDDNLDEVGRVKNWFPDESKVCELMVESRVG